ncbi:MAG TPA: hypothetical protein VMD31_03820 [Opitutaceae bacterium]|nr:hypothetical protein [Opitutaceae bacterium]
MRSRCRALVPFALLPLLSACATAPAPDQAGAAPAAAAATATAAADQPEQKLVIGMNGDQVRQIMGEPAKIVPRPVPKGTAEVWVYERRTIGPTQQIQVGVHPVTITEMGADGVSRQRVLSEEPIYRQAHLKTVETIQVVMINGRYLEHVTTAQKQQEFE